MNPKLSELHEKAMRLPLRPGVYIMKNKKGEIIYIGKAKALKNRVSQYFAASADHTPKVRRMVDNVDFFEYIVTDSEYEALVLECSLIKQHKPKYNILLKDDKGYTYIKVSKEMYPRITLARKIENDGAEYIGPFTGGYSVKQAIDEACKIFQLPTCTRVFPRDIGKGRPCLNYSIKQCVAPCRGRVSREEYMEAFEDAVEFVKGGDGSSIERLSAKMEQCAENLEFERAARIRDRIAAIKRMSQRQKVVMSKIPEQDIIAAAQTDDACCTEVFRFLGGRLYDRESFIFGNFIEGGELRSQFIEQYYQKKERIPPKIYIDILPDDRELLERYVSEKAGRKVSLLTAQRGEQQKLVEMCRQNAAEHLAMAKGKIGSHTAALDELAKLLGLPKPPKYIEAYDISNNAGEANVAGMVVFEDGSPLKSAYRKFKIKTVSGQDDYGSMREVISRRIAEYREHKEEGEGFGRLPDLILLDGGEGHVSSVRPIIEEAGLSIPVFGMVKNQKHRTRAIAAGGREVSINSSRSAFTLVSSIQEEVHRFAITFHRNTRGKSVTGSQLTKIEGIGPARARTLLRHFKTIKAVREATKEQLSEAPGMTKAAAEAVFSYFRHEEE
ncbi:MAG: excinuclease ABC subunit UvrC [Oscillospiraceae bacterium]|jgi:excinuclease ABC subunit C|nr:excinuclease ABC subunit UvrC [Oscillospiraceae bacterium]